MKFSWKAIGCIVLILLAGRVASADIWPLDNTGAVHRIWHSYGQWLEAGGIHLHEGIDLPAPKGTNVKAVTKGKVVNIFVGATDYLDYITISDDADPTKGWGYVHVKAKTGLSVGDTVNAGDVIGTITETAAFDAHLHFERDSDKNGGWPPAGGTEHLDDDPLLYLTPSTDATAPTIDGIKYRRGEDEGNDSTPKYFTTLDCNGYAILGSRAPGGASGNVDVVVSAFDKFGSFADKLSIQDIQFHAFGRLGDNTPALTQLVNFEGNGASDFAQQETNNFSKHFRDPTKRFAQAIYENDVIADSKDEGPFWYIVTNQDDDQITESTDDKWFWDTDGIKSEAWNDQLSSDERAANNAKSKFRDDFYDIYINAGDEANNNTSKKETVLVDNWEQTVVADKFFYFLGDDVKEVGGEQYQESDASVPLYVVDTLADCSVISGLGIEASTTTSSNADGSLATASVWTADKLGWFYLLSDYDDDGIYHPRLDAYDPFVVVNPKWFNVISADTVTSTGEPTAPIVAEIALDSGDIPVELVSMSILSTQPAAVFESIGEFELHAIDSGGPGPEMGTELFYGLAFNPGGPGTALPTITELDFGFEIGDLSFDPLMLVDLDGLGTLFNIQVEDTYFHISFETDTPGLAYQFWKLEGFINVEFHGSLAFHSVDMANFDISTYMNLFVNLVTTDVIETGDLFTMKLTSNYIPEPSMLMIVLVMAGRIVRRRP